MVAETHNIYLATLPLPKAKKAAGRGSMGIPRTQFIVNYIELKMQRCTEDAGTSLVKVQHYITLHYITVPY